MEPLTVLEPNVMVQLIANLANVKNSVKNFLSEVKRIT